MIDLILALVLIGYTVSGFRQGFLVSALSLVGFLGGGALAMWLLPKLLSGWLNGPTDLRSNLILVGGVLGLAAVGQAVTGTVGARLKSRVHFAPAHAVDAALGAVASLVAISLLTWFVAGAVRGVAGPVSRQIGQSRIVAALDDIVPVQASQLFSGFRGLLDRGGFPKVFESLGPERILPIDPPDGSVTTTEAVRAAAGSMVKVTGVARSCNRSQEGSGWVVAPQRVVTNAHVVAGETAPTVRIGGVGRSYDAQVVIFDAKRDIAVLAVPGLPAPPLKIGADAGRGTSAVVAGFPEDGPYRLAAARVRTVLEAQGQRHLRPAGDHPRGLLAVCPGPAGQLRRPAAVDAGRGHRHRLRDLARRPEHRLCVDHERGRAGPGPGGGSLVAGRHRRLRRRLTPDRAPRRTGFALAVDSGVAARNVRLKTRTRRPNPEPTAKEKRGEGQGLAVAGAVAP